jgi:hypothetical protein
MEEFDLIFSVLNNKNSESDIKELDLPIFKYRKKLKPLTTIQKQEIKENHEKRSDCININTIQNITLDLEKENIINNNKKQRILLHPLINQDDKSELLLNNKFHNSKSEILFKNKIYKEIKIDNNNGKYIGLPPITNNCIRYLDFRPLILSNEKKSVDLGYYYKIGGNDCPLVRSLLEDNGFVDISNYSSAMFNREWTILWSSSSIETSIITKLLKYQKINHFPRSRELTRKDLLYMNIAKLKSNNNKGFDFLPQSFIFPKESKFLEEEMAKDSKMIWIVKPVSSSQGRGIFLTTDFQQVRI